MMTDITNETKQVFASNEILGAALTAKMSQSEVAAFEKDPRSFIASSLDFDTGDISLRTVENSAGMVNLVLPYYSVLDSISAESLGEADISSISGGEIIGVIIATAIGATVLTGLTLGGAGVATATILQGKQGQRLDGSPK